MTGIFQTVLSSPLRGELMALASGLLWAVAVLLYRTAGRSVHPLSLNLVKTGVGTVLLAATFLALRQPLLPSMPLTKYALLAASGVIGITISDSLFFACLNRLGAGLTAVIDCVNIPFVIGLSFLTLGERLSGRQLIGVLAIIAAIVLVSLKKDASLPPRRDLIPGVGLGILAMIALAVGIVMIKPLLRQTPVLWATLFRVACAGLALAAILLAHPRRAQLLRPLASAASWKTMVPGAVLGSYLSIAAWMAGMKYAQASVAAPLSQLNSVFIFVLAAIFLKEKVTGLKTAAVILATVGALAVSWPH